jgi:molybdopterin molybdotransferase
MVILGAADVDTVPVWRRPRVHVLTNGDELAAPGSAAQDSHTIPDSLSEALSLMARQWGAKPMGTWQSPDRADYLRAVTRQVLADADLIVVAGGASHGPRDLVREAMAPSASNWLLQASRSSRASRCGMARSARPMCWACPATRQPR